MSLAIFWRKALTSSSTAMSSCSIFSSFPFSTAAKSHENTACGSFWHFSVARWHVESRKGGAGGNGQVALLVTSINDIASCCGIEDPPAVFAVGIVNIADDKLLYIGCGWLILGCVWGGAPNRDVGAWECGTYRWFSAVTCAGTGLHCSVV